ncbi:MAG TPA: GNAT family N-acetyltransferase [Polyangiales bacterium]|jgi:RimJ/RimL family protein N-acetyltransferase|nr:GNAT family N-acetyltransferase [Polyangiales bacterium]
MSSQIPVLTTDRLSLREHRKSDLKDCLEMWSNPAITRYIAGRAFTREEVWTRILRYLGHWSLLGFGYWLVCERSSGAFVGEVGFANFEREVTPSLGDAPEAGWIVTPAARGQGYALEAIRAAHAWIDEVYGAKRTVCMIDHDNVISQHIARSCGYSVWSDASYHGTPVQLYERSSQLR